MDPTSFDPNKPTPWAKLIRWNLLFHANYMLRLVSFDIWWCSRGCGAPFEELKFGETSLSTVRKILERTPLPEDATIYDLGCGRGRAAFLFHFLTGAKVIAMDLIGSFLLTGRRIARWMGLESKVLFCYQDIRQATLHDADMVFVCASCMGEETRGFLIQRIVACRPGTYLATVGWKPNHPKLTLLDEFQAAYSWGKAGTYISQVCEETI